MCVKDIPCNCHMLNHFHLEKKLLLSITHDIVCVWGRANFSIWTS